MEIRKIQVSNFEKTELISEPIIEHRDKNLQNVRALKAGTILNDQYSIVKVIGEGGFGITYLGYDHYLKVNVAIKEYFPMQFASRNTTMGNDVISVIEGKRSVLFQEGLKAYEYEANRLTQFNTLEGIVNVMNFFFANNTAYMVMEYIDGITLKEYLSQNNGKIPWEMVLEMMEPVIVSLKVIHEAGIIHRDISPDNIMVDKNNKIKIIDFGSARYYEDDKSKTIMLKRGFAPPEQYLKNGKQGPWTDVYSLMATMYKMITGVCLPESLAIVEGNAKIKPISDFVSNIPHFVENLIYEGLAVEVEDRLHSAEEVWRYLYGGETIKRKKRLTRTQRIGSLIVMLMVIIIGAVLYLGRMAQNNNFEKIKMLNERSDGSNLAEQEVQNNLEKSKANDIQDTEENTVNEKNQYLPERFKELAPLGKSYISYTQYEDGVVIEEIDASVTECLLPQEIDGRPVRAIEGIGTNLTALFIPENVKEIKDAAFRNCVYLEYIYIPSSVISISENAFANCFSIKQIEIAPDNEYFYMDDNRLMNTNGDVIFEY